MDTIHTCSKCKSFYKIKETEDENGFCANGKVYCYGNKLDTEQIFRASELGKVKKKGYFMG